MEWLALFQNLEPWFIFFIVGILLSLLEIFLPGFVCLPLGIGALIASPFSRILPFWAALIAWAAASSAVWIVIKRMFRQNKIPNFRSNVDALVGKKVLVTEALDPKTQSGRVKIYGEDWTVIDVGEAIPINQQVEIVEVIGNRVRVRPLMDTEILSEKRFDEKLGSLVNKRDP
ncbi:NfeD family protein [Deltaproteobacteria bacterium TL4]